MRLFIGLDLPWELKQRLAVLGGGIPGARWVPAENYHMTLRFIGEVQPHRAEEIDRAIRTPIRQPRSCNWRPSAMPYCSDPEWSTRTRSPR